MTVAESFKRFRKSRGLTQQQIADALKIHKQVYQRYEYGRSPSADVIIRIADAFDVSADYLLGRTDDPICSSKPLKIKDETPQQL